MVRINSSTGLISKEEIKSRIESNSLPLSDSHIYSVECLGRRFNITESDAFPYGSIVNFMDEEDVRTKFFYPYINEDSIVFDVGANFGTYSLRALCLGARKTIAFEPDPRGVRTLNDNIDLNPGFRDRFVCHEVALINQEAIISLMDLEDVPARTLDYFIDDIPTYIKIDVEGMEWLVIQGAIETIKRYKPKILIENHLKVGKGAMMRQIVRILTREYGYCVDVLPTLQSIAYSLFY